MKAQDLIGKNILANLRNGKTFEFKIYNVEKTRTFSLGIANSDSYKYHIESSRLTDKNKKLYAIIELENGEELTAFNVNKALKKYKYTFK